MPMCFKHSTISALLAALIGLLAAPATQADPPPWERTETRDDCAAFETLRTPHFGETHIHTNYSLDAVINGMDSSAVWMALFISSSAGGAAM